MRRRDLSRGKTHFHLTVELPDGHKVGQTIRIEATDNPEHRQALLKKEARRVLHETANRQRVPVDQVKDMTVTLSEATGEQIRSFERDKARSREMSRGPGLGM